MVLNYGGYPNATDSSQSQQQQQQQAIHYHNHHHQHPNLVPPIPPSLTVPPPPPPPLPPGWITVSDPLSGRPYYANSSTGQTRWDPPPPPPPVPLPPPPRNVAPPPPHFPPSLASSPARGAAAAAVPSSHHHHSHHRMQLPVPLPSPSQPPLHPSSSSPSPFWNNTPTGVSGTVGPSPPAPYHQPQTQSQLPQTQPQLPPNTIGAVLGPLGTTTTTFGTNLGPAATASSRIQAVPNTLNAKGLLIPSARAVLVAESNRLTQLSFSSNSEPCKTPTSPPLLELSELSAGTIADLARVQSEYLSASRDEKDGGGGEDDGTVKKRRYEPLTPFELPIGAKTPHVEPGRVEIRLVSLMDALSRLE